MAFPLDPHWLDSSARLRLSVSPACASWLSDQGSLTSRLIARCPGRFQVRVVRQSWGHPSYSERKILGHAGRQAVLIREVELCCDQHSWVFARTLIPFSSLAGRARQLARLGDKPLGAVLFADPATCRLLTQYARLHYRHSLFHVATTSLNTSPPELWGRRTLYRYAGRPILVNEIFLPALFRS